MLQAFLVKPMEKVPWEKALEELEKWDGMLGLGPIVTIRLIMIGEETADFSLIITNRLESTLFHRKITTTMKVWYLIEYTEHEFAREIKMGV